MARDNVLNLIVFLTFLAAGVVVCARRGSHNQTAQTYAEAYNAAFPVIRSVFSGHLVLDIPGWGQDTSTAVEASPLLEDSFFMFSAHIYPLAFNKVEGKPLTPEDVQNLFYESGRPCIIGEFGDIQNATVLNATSGELCDVKAVVEAAKAVGFRAVYGWAWNGDGGGLNMLAPSWQEEPTATEYVESDYFWSILELL
jgi:mannan endo-1,4-beta-mannosidase